jgi:hypothetical protein
VSKSAAGHEGNGPLLAAAVLGMIVTFGAGWAVARGTSDSGDDPAAVARTLPAESRSPSVTGSPGIGFISPPPTGPPTGQVTSDLSGSLSEAGNLPKVSKAVKAPIPVFACTKPTIRVSTAGQLTSALAVATPGASIWLSPGVYIGEFKARPSGTGTAPIYLCGSRKAVLDAGAVKGGYALHFDGSSHWRVNGFTVQDAQKGVMLDGASDIGLQRLLVQNIGDEAVHLRSGSTSNVVRSLTIRQTGRRKPKFGEGVYIGSAKSNWCEVNKCVADHSDNNYVLSNRMSATSSESVDIKEGTSGGVVAGNRFDGTGMSGADSWVDVKGNGWLITGNIGIRAPEDGFQVHEILDGWGYRNLFNANASTVDSGGYAIHVTKVHSGNVVMCNNKVSAAGDGLTNIACSK